MFDAAPASVFAQFSGVLNSPAEAAQIGIALTGSDFALAKDSTSLGFQVRAASGSVLDPASVQIRRADNSLLIPTVATADIANRTQSLVLADLVLGNYTVTVLSDRGTAGGFELNIYLVGDVNGDRSVGVADGQAILRLLGKVAGDGSYRVEADTNLDSRIDTADYLRWRTNLNDSTRVNPLTLAIAGLLPAAISLPGGTLLTGTTDKQVVGTTRPGAAVALETGSDGNFGEGSGTAQSDGSFSLSLLNQLAGGRNTVQVRARDTFGQERFESIQVALDTRAPNITAGLLNDTGANAADRLTADHTITGIVTDASRITSFRGGFDRMPAEGFFDLLGAVQADGVFILTRPRLAQINGGPLTEGIHTLHLQASDQLGNISLFDVIFTLDTLPPLQPTLELDPASDSPPVGDRQTAEAVVTLVGRTEANARVLLTPTGAARTADGAGGFSFTNLALAAGANPFTVQATDLAGNTSSLSTVITRI